MKLNDFLSQFAENEISVYAVSPSSPAEHAKLKKLHNLDFTFITDVQLIFPSQFGFYDPQSQSVLRGFIGINPETEKMVRYSTQGVLTILIESDNFRGNKYFLTAKFIQIYSLAQIFPLTLIRFGPLHLCHPSLLNHFLFLSKLYRQCPNAPTGYPQQTHLRIIQL